MSETTDSQFVRQFSMVIGIITAFGVAVYLIAGWLQATYGVRHDSESVAQNIAPVGAVNTGEPILPTAPAAAPAVAAAPAAGPTDGKSVYDSACVACHATPAVGAPVLGNADDWKPRLEKGLDTLVSHALNGFQGEKGVMPPKGGRVDLSDDAITAAVHYMVESSGGESMVPAGEAAAAPAAAETPAAPAAEATATAGVDGKGVYDKACFICHASGAAGAPKLGSKEEWAPRIAQGTDLLHEHAIKGYMGSKGLMPPKGGRADLTDDEVKAAVDYMAGTAQ